MTIRKLFLWSALAACVLAGPLQARNLFVMPMTGVNAATSIYLDSGFTSAGSVQGPAAAFDVFYSPVAQKYFVVSESASEGIIVLDDAFQEIQRINLPQQPVAAKLVPDGTRLVIATGSSVLVYSVSSGALVGSVNIGSELKGLAVAQNSSRAFALTRVPARLTAIDLATYTQAGTLDLAPFPESVAVGPNGLVYVSGLNRIQEIDGRTLELRPGGDLSFSGAGAITKIAFTPDGRFLVGLAGDPEPSGNSIVQVNLATHETSSISTVSLGVTLTKVLFVSATKGYAVSSDQRLFDLTVNPLFALESAPPVGIFNSGVRDIAISGEFPQSQYIYVAYQNSFRRYNLVTGESLIKGPFSTTPGKLAVAGPQTLGIPASLFRYNDPQTVEEGSTSLPLILRVSDAAGRPVFGAPVSFTASDPGVTLGRNSSSTNVEGLAETSLTLSNPNTSQVVVNAFTLTGGLTTTFTVNVGSGGNGPVEQKGIRVVSGNGQVVTPQSPITPKPLVVVVTDENGAPLPNIEVTWDISDSSVFGVLAPSSDMSGEQQVIQTRTDNNGRTSVFYRGSTSLMPQDQRFRRSTIRATSSEGDSVEFAVTMMGATHGNPFYLRVVPPESISTISGTAGETIPGAIQVRVATQQGTPMPFVGLEVSVTDPNGPSAVCAGDTALSNQEGLVTCDLVLGPIPGTAPLTATLAGGVPAGRLYSLVLEVKPSPVASITILEGNNQTGAAGERLPQDLVAQVLNASGEPVPGATVVWSFDKPNTGRLIGATNVADSQGRVSSGIELGQTAGEVVVRVTSGAASVSWTLHVGEPAGQLTIVSGNNQNAVQNQSFAQPLVVEVQDSNGQPMANQTVGFAVTSGSATLSSATATTNAQGRASVTVQAGADEGPVVVTATVQGRTATFNLNVSPRPMLDVVIAGFTNGADFRPGISPGEIVTIFGVGLAPGLEGCVSGGSVVGALPTTLRGVTVTFGITVAPIFSICNVNGQEQVTVQAPFELGAGGKVGVEIRVGDNSTMVHDIPVSFAHPGIFQTEHNGRNIAVLLKEDGSLVSPDNPATAGDRVRMFATGLGPVLPLTGTNRPGIGGQRVYFPIIVGVNHGGVKVLSAEYAANMIGVYAIDFEVPSGLSGEATIQLTVLSEDESETVSAADSLFTIQ